mmetsp:Transcript_46606/g.117362  ORF Transcript_46606/g.117362 Transcript_46606/m.117362 type:complete len:291 (-) Transcript_46606:483-1355(-)
MTVCMCVGGQRWRGGASQALGVATARGQACAAGGGRGSSVRPPLHGRHVQQQLPRHALVLERLRAAGEGAGREGRHQHVRPHGHLLLRHVHEVIQALDRVGQQKATVESLAIRQPYNNMHNIAFRGLGRLVGEAPSFFLQEIPSLLLLLPQSLLLLELLALLLLGFPLLLLVFREGAHQLLLLLLPQAPRFHADLPFATGTGDQGCVALNVDDQVIQKALLSVLATAVNWHNCSVRAVGIHQREDGHKGEGRDTHGGKKAMPLHIRHISHPEDEVFVNKFFGCWVEQHIP